MLKGPWSLGEKGRGNVPGEGAGIGKGWGTRQGTVHTCMYVAAINLITACKSFFSCYKESPFCPKYLAPLLPPAIPSLYLSLWDSPGSLAAGKGQVGGQEDSTGEKETGSSPQAWSALGPSWPHLTALTRPAGWRPTELFGSLGEAI